MRFKSLTLLGSTGSIGQQTIDVLRQFRREIALVGLSAGGNNVALLAEQAVEFQPAWLHVGDSARVGELRAALEGRWSGTLLAGDEGLVAMAKEAPADLVLIATVGWTGLEPALAAISAGRSIALANKEALVCGGHLVTGAAREAGTLILPVDSEHNAIFQCLQASPNAPVRRMILTCSGGPYRQSTREVILAAGPETTLRHPTWSMGSKITVDSATLMNKGFEVIEAHHLFGIPYEKIQVVIHPQSTIHSMVEFVDGSILAQLGQTDMRLPIQYALTWPSRRPTTTPPLDFKRLANLTFDEPDLERFPALAMAYEAGRIGGSAPCVLNAANEVAVKLHLDGRISCGGIPELLAAVMQRHVATVDPDMEELRHWDRWARAVALEEAAHCAAIPGR